MFKFNYTYLPKKIRPKINNNLESKNVINIKISSICSYTYNCLHICLLKYNYGVYKIFELSKYDILYYFYNLLTDDNKKHFNIKHNEIIDYRLSKQSIKYIISCYTDDDIEFNRLNTYFDKREAFLNFIFKLK